nr:MAG TPA: hypothetical protein [Caudoviricetes sp.]
MTVKIYFMYFALTNPYWALDVYTRIAQNQQRQVSGASNDRCEPSLQRPKRGT